MQKLDKSSRKAWELKLRDSLEFPAFAELDRFLVSRIRALEAIIPVGAKDKQTAKQKAKTYVSHSALTSPLSCPVCKASHLLYQCSTFLKQTPNERAEFIRNQKRCFNCLSAKHSVKECTSFRVCKQCNKKHHTLLHYESAKPSEMKVSSTSAPAIHEKASLASSSTAESSKVASHVVSNIALPSYQILLATARVRVHSPRGRAITIRALIDQGSAATLISESIVQFLRLSKIRNSVCVTGIGEAKSVVRHTVNVRISPFDDNGPVYSTTALVLKSLTKYAPRQPYPVGEWKHIVGLKLADKEPLNNDSIQLIIGADLFGPVILDGVRKGSPEEPVAQNTTFGWILSGPFAPSPSNTPTLLPVHHGTILKPLDAEIRRFWEVEAIPSKSHLSDEAQAYDQHFETTRTRTSQGRYVVRLPFRVNPPISIGESRNAALANLHCLERRLARDPKTEIDYRDFLDKYLTLGHMEAIHSTREGSNSSQHYYIPHHAVIRDNSETTRLRVVFNASSHSTNGTSINDHLFIGPKLQLDIVSVLLRWRQYRYVYTADISKMYRQILVDPRDTDYQRILWRSSPDKSVQDYRLLTVTYGTAAAPYLALRVIQQLATDEGAHFPIAVPVVQSQIYVDDCIFGADNQVIARQTRNQLIDLFKRGGFHLRKWASNCPELLSDIDPSDHGLACLKTL